MTSWQTTLQRGAACCLALLLCTDAWSDAALRERIHREYKHQSYMLVESPDGHRLFLFSAGSEPVRPIDVEEDDAALLSALAKTRSPDPALRTLGLTELAGMPGAEALDVALSLLTDPSAAVRDEAAQLILDHPQGAALARTLGLAEDDGED